jgi:cell division protein FtsA
MRSQKKGKIIACLDMGTSNLVCLIASIINDDEIEILGFGHKAAKGILDSSISDMKIAEKAIKNTIFEAERMADCNISKVVVGISGSQVKSSIKEFSVNISSGVIKSSDINSIVEKIRLAYKKENKTILHLIPLRYRIDESLIVENPIYMSGKKLHIKFHVVSTSKTTITNIENCLKNCQLSVDSYVVEPFASTFACLNNNEMNLNTLFIDIGGSSSSFAILMDGKLSFVGNCLIGGKHITKDIATILNISTSYAEKIKNLNSSVVISPIEEKELIKLSTFDENEIASNIMINRLDFCEILKSRIEEIFESIKSSIEKTNFPLHLLSNIVISGGVASTIGIDRIASSIFNKNVRIGYPSKIKNISYQLQNPSHSCSIGMIIFMQKKLITEKNKSSFQVKESWLKKLILKLAS